MTPLARALLAELDAEAIDALPEDALAALARRLGLHQPMKRQESSIDVATGRLTCLEAATLAAVHVETIRRAARSGALTAGRVGRSMRIRAG